ncbi:MAG: molybdopterin-dependent oxidoreductase [Rhodoplanes sp.]
MDDVQTYNSVCRGCHGGCGVVLHVKDDKLVKVKGNPASPLNHGRLCPIGNAASDLVHHPDRLKYPLRRKGARGSGQWQRISWDDALGEMAEKLNRIRATDGAHTILMGTGTGRHHAAWVSRFGHAMGTPNWCEPGFAQCFFPRLNTQIVTYGGICCNDLTGDTGPACILFWGHNSIISGPDGETRFAVHKALEHGPKTIVVDPRQSDLAKTADIWLPLRPGTDGAMALAFSNVIIGEGLYDAEFVEKWTSGFPQLAAHVKNFTPEWAEKVTSVPAEKIRAAARLFALTRPGMLEWGCAIEHTPNALQTCRTLAMLPALTGNIDKPGAWIIGMQALGGFPDLLHTLPPEVRAKRLGFDKYKLLAGEEAFYPGAHIPTALHAMKTGDPYKINAFLVFGNNTLATYANTQSIAAAVGNVPFVTYTDLFMTPSANAFADIVLPAASWPELNQISAYPFFSENVLMPQQRALRIGECRSDEEIFVELARRMGLAHCTESVEETLEEQLRAAGCPLTFDALCAKGHYEVPLRYRKFEKKGFNTPSGKIELYSTALERLGYPPLPLYQEPPESPISRPDLVKKFPLVLTTGARVRNFFLSEGRQIERLRKAHREPLADIHPDTAEKFGIKNGDWIWIESLRGRFQQKARCVEGMHRDTVAIEVGWWFPEEKDTEMGIYRSGANMLTNNEPPFDPQMGTYQLRALLCRVRKFSRV